MLVIDFVLPNSFYEQLHKSQILDFYIKSALMST